MSSRDPAHAPARSDLPFLKHRGRLGEVPRPVGVNVSLDLDPSAPAETTPTAAGNELNLSAPPAAPHVPAPSPASPPSTRPPTTTSIPKSSRGFRRRRTSAAAATHLTPEEPTVTLTRLQSGVGALTIEAACTESAGDFRLGAVYTLASGVTSVVQFGSETNVAPPRSSRPIVIASRGKFQQLTVDLRQSRQLSRFLVYLVAGSLQPVTWSGALVVTTFGGARIEMPIVAAPSTHVQVLVSVFNVTGEFVLRGEGIDIPGDLRNCAAAYGFERIAWLDGNTVLA